MSRQLIKSTAVVSGLTLMSRLLGFVRDMLIARLFGVDLATDAFFVAFKIPNFLRRLFTEGAFAHAFIPVLADYQAQNDPAAVRQFIGKAAGMWAFMLLVLTLIGVVAAPLLILVLAPGFDWQGPQHELAVLMLQITFPYLLFIALVAFAGGILNAYHQFVIPALTPALLNVSMIAAAIWLAPYLDEPVMALAWGVLIAGIAQLALQIPALLRLGLLPRLRLDFQDTGVKRLFKRIVPAIFSVSVTQINLLLDTLIASFLTVGSVSWLYYSDRLVEFPQGLLGLALGTVILPQLAKHHAQADPQAFSNALDWGLRLVLLTGIPATIGLILLSEPMLVTMFQYEEFTHADVLLAGQSLKAYALGLLGFLMIKVLVPGFTARQDLTTPLRYGGYAMAVSLAGNVLAIPLAHAGLALATSLGAIINALLLLYKLRQERVYQAAAGWWPFLVRIGLASAAMAASLYYGVDADDWQQWRTAARIVNLLKFILLGMGVYGAVLLMTGLRLRHLSVAHDKINNFLPS
ncbi:MAG: murein biosynthesis integral membrane protein MurJ [Methylovulum sp.]|nr:murein biosynthesis integral membrane protein MurJ [Methylovulum sp.]